MSTTQQVKPGDRIWDWDVIQALYMGGMELSQIVKIPRFTELSLKYLQNKASREKWKDSRDAARLEGTGEIAQSLITKMGQAEQDHQHWVLDALDEERRIFEKTKTKGGGKDQIMRLEVIERINNNVRKTLGLDDRKPLNDQQKNLGILIHLKSHPPKAKGLASTTTIAIGITNGEMTRGQMEAAKIIEEYQDEPEEKEKPLPPGIQPLAPFRAKGEGKPLVNENSDIIETINQPGTGFHAVEITHSEERASMEVIRERVRNLTGGADNE